MSRPRHSVHNVILSIMSLATAVLVGWVVFNAWDFYTTAYVDRPHHDVFRTMRPAGFVGHGLGILGTAMLLLLFLYSARKRLKFMAGWGDVRIWLRYHIFLGVAGPILVTLHTSFKFNGLVSISYWSMIAVAVSGFVGRYLYQQIPRNMLGEALNADEMEARNEEIVVTLSNEHGVNDQLLANMEESASAGLANLPALLALLVLPFKNLMLARKLRKLFIASGVQPRTEAVKLAREWVLLTRRLLLFHQIRDLFHYWHVFHKPFAVIMVLVMVVHVVVVLMLGYTWSLSDLPASLSG